MTFKRGRRGGGLWLCAAMLAMCLAGCNDTLVSDAGSMAGGRAARLALRPGVSPSGATVAFTSVDGAPAAFSARFSEILASSAASRDIATADVKTADYLVRGYLTAYPADRGTAIAYVWDVFDGHKQRMQRLEDVIVVPHSAADAWSVVDQTTLASIAGKSADDLAAFLSNTPEAIAAAGKGTAAIAAAAPPSQAAPSQALGYAAFH